MSPDDDLSLEALQREIQNRDASPEHSGMVFTDWSSVRLERLCWLMVDRLPLAELTIVEGDGGLGKTTAVLDIAARLSTGRPMPDGTRTEGPADVLLIAEEDRESILKARLLVAGADLGRIHHVACVGDNRERFSLPSHAPSLLVAAVACDARLIVIDALFNHFDAGLKSALSEDVRRVLAPLSVIAHQTQSAIIGIRHWGKTARDAGSRGLGSADIKNIARSVLSIGRHPHDENGPRIMAVAKSNLGQDITRVRSLSFSLVSETAKDDCAEVSVARVVWGEEVAITADELANTIQPTADESTQTRACADRIRSLLADGPLATKAILAALADEGFSRATTFRAAKKVPITAEHSGFPRVGKWRIADSGLSQQSHARDREINDTSDTTETSGRQSSQLSQSSHNGEADTPGETAGSDEAVIAV